MPYSSTRRILEVGFVVGWEGNLTMNDTQVNVSRRAGHGCGIVEGKSVLLDKTGKVIESDREGLSTAVLAGLAGIRRVGEHWPLIAGVTGLVAYGAVWGAAALFYSQLGLDPTAVGLGYGELLQKAIGLAVFSLLAAAFLSGYVVAASVGVWIRSRWPLLGWMARAMLAATVLVVTDVLARGMFPAWQPPWTRQLEFMRSLVESYHFRSSPFSPVPIGYAFMLISAVAFSHWRGPISLERLRRVFGLTRLMPLVIAFALYFYWSTAYLAGNQVREGYLPQFIPPIVVYPFDAERVRVYGVTFDPSVEPKCLLYLGQAGETAILWESKHREVVRVPTRPGAILVLGSKKNDCPK